jgi:lactoylglutathione lyase
MDGPPEISSLVLFSADSGRTVAFYRALGLPLVDERHEEGPPHMVTELGDIHFAIYQAESGGRAPGRRVAGSTFGGFYVGSLDQVQSELTSAGVRLLTEHERMPWGCRIVVEDPDGRAVEINQRGHCRDD